MADAESRALSNDDARPKRGPLVFVSHDSRDAVVAEAFSKLLGNVSAGMLKTFRSSDKKGSQGFEYGVEWYPELMKTLESACDVVCLLTEKGLGRPWMLYEAGVAKGKLDIPVHGLALGVPLTKASVGPFAQFQNCGDDLESIAKLVVQLVQRLPHADPDLDTVRSQVEVFKTRLDEALAERPPENDGVSTPQGDESTAKLFEEIKVMFQDLPSRVESVVLEDSRGQRARRVHPGMVDELIMMTSRGERPRPGLAAMIAASFFRDDIPWLYEMAAQAYRLSMLGESEAERRAVVTFITACEMISHGPFMREMGRRRDLPMLVREIPMLLERFVTDREELTESEE